MLATWGSLRDQGANLLSEGHQQTFLFAWRFALFSVLGIGLFYFAPVDLLLEPLLFVLATLVGGLLQVAGLPVIVSGHKVVLPGVFGIDIAAECSGAPHLLLFLSAVFAYPTSSRSRLVGVALASVAVFVGNLVRLFTLLWVGVHAREYFDVAHFYIWGGLSYAALVLLWMVWLRLSARQGTGKI